MFKTLLGLFLALCCGSACTARTETKKQPPLANSLLWRISGKGLSKPSYLFGTIHMICKDDYLWTPAMQRSFKEAGALCLEMDMDDPGLMMQVMMGMMSTDGTQLKDHFTPAQYTRLEKYAKDSLGMGLEMFQSMKPVMLVTLLAQKGAKSACDSPVSYELNLTQLAKSAEKDVEGLEEAKEQLDVLNGLPTDSVVHEVMDIVDGKESEAGDFDKMVAAYKAQDLNQLDGLLDAGGGMMDQRGAFLDDRNRRWISRMEGKMKGESVFFAVGAGHLPGTNGVIELLRKAGYTVTPVQQ